MWRRLWVTCGLLGCGRISFDPQGEVSRDATAIDGPPSTADAAPALCWDGPIVVSAPGNAAYGVTLAVDGQDLVVMWASAYDTQSVEDDYGTLWFRRFDSNGAPRQPATALALADLGLVNAASPSLLATADGVVVTYSGHTGDINSGGQLRAIQLDATGSPLGPSTHISGNFAAPSPGVTAGGIANSLVPIGDGATLAVGVYGKYPWGGVGEWLRGAYLLEAATLQRVDSFMCHVCYGDHPERAGNAGFDGATFHDPVDDTLALLAAAAEGPNWVTRMRWIDRSNTLVDEAELDRYGAAFDDPPNVAAAWDPVAEQYVVLHTRKVDGTYALRMTTIAGRAPTFVRDLWTSDQRFGFVRMLRRADGGYWWVASSGALLQVSQLTARLAATGDILGIITAEGDYALAEHAGRLIMASRDAAATEVRLRCFDAN